MNMVPSGVEIEITMKSTTEAVLMKNFVICNKDLENPGPLLNIVCIFMIFLLKVFKIQ